MRNAFIRFLTEYAKNEEKMILMTADMGFSVFEEFSSLYPQQFYNVGIAEATMTSMAAGLAMQGYRPVIYSIVPFVTMRNLEQLRVDVCYQQLPVVIVGVGSGFSYGASGSTHHSLEDISLMRSLPHMQVVVPSDPMEAQAALRFALESERPTYIRLGKNNEPHLHSNPPSLLKGVLSIREGDDIALIGVGSIVNEALSAADMLSNEGYHVAVYSLPMVKPLPTKELEKLFDRYRMVVVIEEHMLNGGAGSAILEALHDRGLSLQNRFLRIGLPDEFPTIYGTQQYLLAHYGLDREHLVSTVMKFINAWSG